MAIDKITVLTISFAFPPSHLQHNYHDPVDNKSDVFTPVKGKHCKKESLVILHFECTHQSNGGDNRVTRLSIPPLAR